MIRSNGGTRRNTCMGSISIAVDTAIYSRIGGTSSFEACGYLAVEYRPTTRRRRPALFSREITGSLHDELQTPPAHEHNYGAAKIAKGPY